MTYKYGSNISDNDLSILKASLTDSQLNVWKEWEDSIPAGSDLLRQQQESAYYAYTLDSNNKANGSIFDRFMSDRVVRDEVNAYYDVAKTYDAYDLGVGLVAADLSSSGLTKHPAVGFTSRHKKNSQLAVILKNGGS